MSSDLPARPSLEYLKKRAKDLLRELQKQNPGAKLAEAQHQIAREHGFLNWSQLKEAVTLRASNPPAPVQRQRGLFARFTMRARQATFFSRFEAAQFGHPLIDPEHLLLGIVSARAGLQARWLADAGVSAEHIRAYISARRSSGEPIGLRTPISFSEGTKRATEHAGSEADRLNHEDIGTAHLLLGLLNDDASMASAILRERGLDLEAVRRDVGALLNEE